MEQLVDLFSKSLLLSIQPESLMYIVIGVLIGCFSSMFPGVTPITPMGVMLPFTFGMRPENAILLFVGILVGSQFSNSIPAVLIRAPGTPSSLMTSIEGYELQRRGEGGRALGVALVASTIGQFISFLLASSLLVPLAEIAVYFLFPEMFALSILALTCAVTLGGKSVAKGFVAAAFGIALMTVGPDPVSSVPRFAYGNLWLEAGLDMLPCLLGILVIGEILFSARQSYTWPKAEGLGKGRILPTWSELRQLDRSMLVGVLAGFWMGILPGAGPAAGALLAYQQAKVFARKPQQFGKGSIEGVAAADAANNAAAAGDLVPTLVFGIPGGPTMVMILAALTIHGITPGPMLFTSAPEAIHATIGGLLTATIATFFVGYAIIRPSIYVLSLSRPVVYTGALLISIVAIYTVRMAVFDVYVMLILGVISYYMRVYGYPVAPAALGLVLGDLIEHNLRRGLVMMFGDWGMFFGRTPVMVILGLAVIALVYPFVVDWVKNRKQAAHAGGVDQPGNN